MNTQNGFGRLCDLERHIHIIWNISFWICLLCIIAGGVLYGLDIISFLSFLSVICGLVIVMTALKFVEKKAIPWQQTRIIRQNLLPHC